MRKFTQSVLAVALALAPVVSTAQGVAGTMTVNTPSLSYLSGSAAGGFMGTATFSFAAGTWSIFCIDDNNGISLGNVTFDVFGTNVVASQNYDWTRVGSNTPPGLNQTDAEAFTRYNRAKQFAAAINMGMGDSPANRTQQVAMWDVTDNGVNAGPVQAAASANTTTSLNAMVISGRTNQSLNLRQQELIAIQPTVVVPEPSTYALVATGLAAMVFVARRRRQA
ncbi:MAG: PEP-CTERM sorting domain-containing protein [Gemmatimonadaceae bacterium]|jgi:hypothetical protein|nr:PEP-CTERM sorting domain-containing protein [Gemmatimonadaceae bacterium]